MSQAEYPNVTVNEEDAKAFLNDLRDSSEINMFGAVPHLELEFDMAHNEAKAVLMWWMEQF